MRASCTLPGPEAVQHDEADEDEHETECFGLGHGVCPGPEVGEPRQAERAHDQEPGPRNEEDGSDQVDHRDLLDSR
jgi:hypothetical protein